MPENRKLIFRAWDEKAEVMVHGVCPYAEGDHIGFSVDDAEAAYTKDQLEDMPQAEDWYYLLDNFKTMQYTGLKDKNGKEIYEGDIATVWTMDKEGYDFRCVIRFEYAMWVVHSLVRKFPFNQFLYLWNSRLEIMGNIYQNPELLTHQPPP